MTPQGPAETFDGTTLGPIWNKLKGQERVMTEADAWFAHSQVLTDRRLDSSHRAGIRAYITASQLIGFAREHQHFLEASLTLPGSHVYPHATPNLIRPAFESALIALWILDGPNADERRLRGLRHCWEDQRQSNNWADELLVSSLVDVTTTDRVREARDVVRKRYHADAADLHLTWDQVTRRPDLLKAIDSLTHVDRQPLLKPFLRSIWRRLSGLQHGLSYASLLSAEMEVKVPVPGGLQVTLLTDDDALMTDCKASALVQSWAMHTYLTRTRTLDS